MSTKMWLLGQGTEAESPVSTKMCVVSSSSPSTKVSMHTQLIDQLEKWNKLHTNGAIDDTEYKELRESILTDIKMCKIDTKITESELT